MTAFTHYWKNDTFEHTWANGHEGERLNHTAGNIFANADVKKGDAVYVITVIKGELFLVGRMTVEKSPQMLKRGVYWETTSGPQMFISLLSTANAPP